MVFSVFAESTRTEFCSDFNFVSIVLKSGLGTSFNADVTYLIRSYRRSCAPRPRPAQPRESVSSAPRHFKGWFLTVSV